MAINDAPPNPSPLEAVEAGMRSLRMNQATNTTLEHLVALEKVYIAALDSGKPTMAQEIYNQIKQLLPEKLNETSNRLAKLNGLGLEFTTNDLDGALSIYEQALERDDTLLYIRKRIISINSTKSINSPPSASIERLVNHTDTFPSDLEAWAMLTNLYLNEQMFTQALFCVEEMMLLKPADPTLFIRYGEISYTAGNFSTAVRFFCKAVEVAENSARGWWGLRSACKTLTEEFHKLSVSSPTTKSSNKNQDLLLGVEGLTIEKIKSLLELSKSQLLLLYKKVEKSNPTCSRLVTQIVDEK